MAHKVMRISKDILTKPQLITPQKFEEIAEYLENRNNSSNFSLESFPREREDQGYLYEGNDKTGVLKIYGPLSYREPTGIEALCGDVVSYESLLREGKKLCENPLIENIILDVDSGGGQAYRCFSTARQLREMCDAAGKKLIAYCDGMAASAAYALACVAHEFIINPDAEAGSIGVVVRLVSNNRALKDNGIDITYVQAGESKTPYDEDGNFKEDFLGDLQNRVDKLYNNFVTHVANMRNISEEAVRSTEAKVFDADKALELGLVDAIMEAEEFKEKYLVGESSTLSTSNTNDDKQKVKTMSKTVESVDMAAFEAMQKELSALKAEKLAKETAAKKEAITQSLAGNTFLSNKESITDFLMEANETQAKLVNTILNDASAKLTEQAEEAKAHLETVTKELNDSIAQLTAEKEQMTADHGKFKEEFAKPSAIRGEEKEENLQALDHKEKLARAVAEAKAKRQAK